MEINKINSSLICGALGILAIGLVTSTTLLSLSHIFMAIPAIYFLNKGNYRNFPKSAWALFALIIVLALSVIVNQDIAVKGYKPLSKIKYFIFGFASIVPLSWYVKNKLSDKTISWLLGLFLVATAVASVTGLIGLKTGHNPLLSRIAHPDRNSGLFGMVMNYSHNLSFFLIITTGLLLYKKDSVKYLNTLFVIVVLIINLIGFYYSYTRGAWLGFIFGLPFFYFKKAPKLFVSAMIGLFILGAVTYQIAGENVIRPTSNEERINQWKAAAYAAYERPILGIGYLNFENMSREIKLRHQIGSEKFVSHTHNNFFEMLAGAGVIGLAVYCLWLGLWLIEVYKRQDLVAKISFPFIIVFIVCGLTQSTISLGINLFFIMASYSISMIDPKLVKD